ncbi:hypothetical protein GQ53DRAFT_864438 [Thozetella sp. PMI_491]|nr:hypothetical protein GQ53DRAFT_864438 [Thozetella sp. PMI_491]
MAAQSSDASSKTANSVADDKAYNDDITQIWAQVEARVLQMAGGDRAKINDGLDIDSVLTYLDKVQEDDRKAAAQYSTARTVFNRMLQAISTVGGIVSDGASNVFAPAGMCYNALTFVIQAWRGYEGIFDSLAALLEKCSEFFDRLAEYAQTGMDRKLSRVACQFLELFVRICDRALQLRKKRAKFAAFMKQLFLNDDGMQDLLNQMKNLAEKERGLVIAQTWSKSSEAASNSRDSLVLAKKADTQLGSLVEGQTQEKKERDTEKWKEIVAKALGFDPSTTSAKRTQPWEAAFNRHRNALLEGSGEWLLREPIFDSWARGSAGASPILGLEGGDGAGKTTLMSSIITPLKRLRGRDGSTERSTVAYYFIEKDSKAVSNGREVESAATRSLLFQLATSDDPYLKSVASICDKVRSFTSLQDMWTQLLLENEDRRTMDNAFFIAVDGLDDNIGGLLYLLRKLSDSSATLRTRVLLTGSHSMFESIESAGVVFSRITLGEKNKPDIELFVKARMDEMDTLKDSKRPEVSEMREKIRTCLGSMTDGDYYKIGRVLDDIEKTAEVEEIEMLLETAGLTRPDKIEADIEKLNCTRTAKEISEINEIILWVNSARQWLKPNEMEAALALRAQRGGVGAATSLLSLETKLQTKYSLFAIDSYNEVDYKVSGIREKIPARKRHGNEEGPPDGTGEVQPTEVNIVKHYLSVVCPPDVYQKFGFDEFFQQKLVRKGNYIYQDADNSHITLALRCMSCLIGQRTEKTESLRDYSANNLLYHLEEADLSIAERDLKEEAGVLFLRLLTEDHAICSLFWGAKPQADGWLGITFDTVINPSALTAESWCDWILHDAGVRIAAKLFGDSAVLEDIKTQSLPALFKEKESDRHKILFEKVAKRAAGQVFQGGWSKHSMLYCFLVLIGILTKATEKKADDTSTSTILEALFNVTPEMVQLVEDWSQKLLDVTEKDVHWEAQKALLLVYCQSSHDTITNKHIETQALKVLDLDPRNCVARYTLAKAHQSRDEAIEMLTDLIEELHGKTEWRALEGNDAMLAGMLVDLADKYWESDHQTDLAITTYFRALDVDLSPLTLGRFIFILWNYGDRNRWDVFMQSLERLLKGPGISDEIAAKFALRLLMGAHNSEERIAQAMASENRWDLATMVYEKALTATSEPMELYTIRTQYARVLESRKGHEEAAIPVLEDALRRLDDIRTDGLRSWATNGLLTTLVWVYTRQSVMKAAEPDVVSHYHHKIEELYERFKSMDQMGKQLRIDFFSYFHHRGDENKAKEVVKSLVAEALEMLSDDVIENDDMSFWDLSLVFSVRGDIPNALIAWEMMEKSEQAVYAVYLEKKKAWDEKMALRNTGVLEASLVPPAASNNASVPLEMEEGDNRGGKGEKDEKDDEDDEYKDDQEPKEPDTTICYCDGDCGYGWKHSTEIWICKNSGYIQLNESCYQRLQNGTLQVKNCSKDHDFYYISKRDEAKYAAVPKGHVLLGDKAIALEDWKAQVKAEYVDCAGPEPTRD